MHFNEKVVIGKINVRVTVCTSFGHTNKKTKQQEKDKIK